MEKQLIIKELQHKALNGDEQALDLYNEYVNRGEASRIAPKQQFKSSVETRSMILDGYKAETEKRGEDLATTMFGQSVDPTKLHEIVKSPYAKISSGYAIRQQAQDERKAEANQVTENTQEKAQAKYEEATQSKTFDEMFKSPFDKTSASYKQ